jgi:hypothetical protein
VSEDEKQVETASSGGGLLCKDGGKERGWEGGQAALCGRVREGNERQQMSVGVSRSGHGADLRRDFSLDGFPTL